MAMPDDFMEQMENFFKNMKPEDRQKMMQNMMSKMMGDMKMSDMMPLMVSKMMGDKKKGEQSGMPCMDKPEDFKPWEFCPCRNLCENGFEKRDRKGEETTDD
jgi:hypothetical protein